MPLKQFFIPYNTPSSKNSKIWNSEIGMLFNSKTVQRWLRYTKYDWLEMREEFIEEIRELPLPYFIHMTFVRDSIREFDFNNASQIITDTMVKYGWIPDDSMLYCVPVYGKPFKDADNAGVIIRVLKSPPKYEL